MPRMYLIASIAWRLPITPPIAPDNTSLFAGRYGILRRRILEYAAIAGTFSRHIGHELTLEPDDSGMGERFLCHNAGIVDEELCREIICAVNYEIIVLDKIHDVFAGDESPVGIDLDIRIDRPHSFLCRLYLRLAHISGSMNDLPLKVGQVYLICVCNAR